ncbi:phosphomannomutase/phosphoglucomutase [Pseudomonas duriflava]|uniref:Phosphomannomutase/phosphoglucomutase n=2 Tax=Pseudomonas duriflava TaxID=459528 RepID=A0A562QLK4_9PSED|nr:phosphomannomutase/phosphoglucomutase [Pseudomonas duriflava]
MKRAKRTAQAARPAQTVPVSLLPSLALALIVAFLALALLWLLVFVPLREDIHAHQRQAWGQAQAAMVSQAVRQLDARAQATAAEPMVIQALGQSNEELRLSAEQILKHGGLVDAHLVRASTNQPDENRPGPLNFAALDLLRRAELGQPAPPEAYRIDQKWLVYVAAPVRAVKEGPVLGNVLLVQDLQPLTSGLMAAPAEAGHWQLVQRFSQAAPQRLAEGGQAGEGAAQGFPTINPLWTVQLAPVETALTDLPLLPWLVALIMSLAGSFLGLRLYQHRFKRILRDDVRSLIVFSQELVKGLVAQRPALRIPELEPLAQALVEPQSKPAETDLSVTEPVEATVTTLARQGNGPYAEPMFQSSDDILDIDILDEDQDLLGLEKPLMSTTVQAPTLNTSIFRAYDIRGVVGDSLTAETAYWIGRAIGSESLARNEPNVAVGRDGRLSGPELVEQLIKGIADTGANVSDIGMVPTPVLYYAANVLAGKSGVMLTGSHNPPDYNGFKIVIAGETLANESIQGLRERIETGNVASGQGTIEKVDVLDRYFEQIRSDIALAKKMKVVVDCGNGVAGVIAPKLIEALGCTVIPLFCDVDGNFPNHHPDPGKPENLEDLIAKVKETGADLGLAFDGDGDRVGVVTNEGNIIYPDQLLMLFAKDVVSRNPGADIIFDVKCTRRLNNLIAGYGGRPIMWKTGHSLIKKKMKETGALLAGEMSGHVFFKERWFGFDDGIYSAVRLLEILSQEKGTAQAVFDTFPVDISTPEINIQVTEESKFGIIDALQRDAQWGDAQVTTLDGVRVDYHAGWGLVRASNTTPVLVLRFEGETVEELERIKDVFRKQLLAVKPDLNLPF